MGGCAYSIPGHVAAEVLERPREQPGFWARLIGRKPEEVRRVDWGDSTMIDVPCTGLSEAIDREFRSYLKEKLPNPNEPSSLIFDYLKIGVINVYIRGDETSQGRNWYTQISFSGCAGMAQISSEICAHWAEKWVNERFAAVIQPLLKNYGFEARKAAPSMEPEPRFVTVEMEDLKTYASVWEGEVEVDAAYYEELTEDYDEFQRDLKERLTEQIESKRCECQLCER